MKAHLSVNSRTAATSGTALFDRFLLRCHVDNLPRDAMPRLLLAGWELERTEPAESSVTAAELDGLRREVFRVDLTPAAEAYREAVFKVRDLGIALSDRRAVKVMKLLAASAVLCGRERGQPSDLWVVRYVWDREEQIEPLAALVNGILEQHAQEPDRHVLAEPRRTASGEELARQIDTLEKELTGTLTLSTAARLRERLAGLADQAAWLADSRVRDHLLQRTRQCLARLG